MIIYTILSLVLIGLEIAMITFFAQKVIRQHVVFSKKTLWYFLPVFVLVYCVYLTGFLYNCFESDTKFTALNAMQLISVVTGSFIFNVNVAMITPLALENPWYLIAACVAIAMAGLTLVSSAVSIMGSQVNNNFRVKQAIRKRHEFVVGDSASARAYAKRNQAILISFGDKEKAKALIADQILTIVTQKGEVDKGLRRRLKKAPSLRKCQKLGLSEMQKFIVFADNNFNLNEIIDWFTKLTAGLPNNFFTLMLESSVDEMDIIDRKFIDKSKSGNVCIESFSKYELIARQFIRDYPLSLALPENFYGPHRTIKADKKINVIFLGFGKINTEIANAMMIQNQFVGIDQNKKQFVSHPVNYYCFDRNSSNLKGEIFLNLENATKGCPDLPAPEPICRLVTNAEANVYDVGFIKSLGKIIEDKNAFTYIIISFGEDYHNVSYAEQLQNFYPQGDHLKIFVRVAKTENLIGPHGHVECFGYEKQIYQPHVIFDENLSDLATTINKTYQKANTDTALDLHIVIKNYNQLSAIEKYSNIYNAISIHFKLGLLGLKFLPAEAVRPDQKAISADELSAMINYQPKIPYKQYFQLDVMNMLAYTEHARWNALYLLKGYQPMPFNELVVKKNGDKVSIVKKNLPLRRHSCLTTFYGLDKLHQHLLKLMHANGDKNAKIEDVEVYQWDYIFVAGATQNLNKQGYVLVQK